MKLLQCQCLLCKKTAFFSKNIIRQAPQHRAYVIPETEGHQYKE